MDFDNYENNLKYVDSNKNPKAYAAYFAENTRIEEQFKSDLFKELNITNNPKAEGLYAKAYSLGHKQGLEAIYDHAYDLVELIN